MRTRIFVLCILLLNAFGVAAVASQQRRTAHTASAAPHRPWLVSVVHKINLVPTFKTNGIQASTIDGGNAYTFNLTTGIVIDHEGHILTRLVNLNPNNPSTDIKVKTSDGRSLKADVLGLDGSTGLTILKATDLNIDPPTFVDDATVDDGQMMRVLSPDFNLVTATVTRGGPSAASKSNDPDSISFFPTMKVLSTTARLTRIEKGKTAQYMLASNMRTRRISDDSIVLNQRGQIVGLTLTSPSEIPSETNDVRQVTRLANMVYPISDARKLADKIISTKSTTKGWLGVSGVSITELTMDERNAFFSWSQLPSRGIVVSKVEPLSPAAIAGLMPNDVLVAFNKQDVTSTDQFSQILAATPIGELTEVQALRDGATVKLQVKLAPRPVIVLKQATIQGTMLATQDLRYRIAILENEFISQQRRMAVMPEGQSRQDAESKLKEIKELLEVQKSALAQMDSQNATVFNAVATGPMPTTPSPNRPSYVALQLKLGMATQDLTDQLRSFFGVPLKTGVLVSTVRAGSVGDAAGIRTGDILVELNGISITNTASYQMALSGIASGKQIKAVVFREKVRKEITFEIPDSPHSQNNPHATGRIGQVDNL